MSVDFGAGGAYGILLTGREDMRPLYDRFVEYVARERALLTDGDVFEPENLPGIEDFTKKFREAFALLGIHVPAQAQMVWSGAENERPGEVATAADSWVLGFGLFTSPAEYPALRPSFVQASKWHTWVWAS